MSRTVAQYPTKCTFEMKKQIDYCVELIELFVKDRIPEITDGGNPQMKMR